MKPGSPTGRSSSRRRLVGAAAVAIVVAVIVALVLTAGGHHTGNSTRNTADAGAAATSSAPASVSLPSPPPTPTPTGRTSDANALPPSLPAVGLGHSAAVGNGVTGTVVGLERVNGTGHGPGNLAGPAVRATIRLTNGTKAPVSVNAVAVDMAYGSGNRPAPPLDDPSGKPFRGMLQPGGSAIGIYVFTVPADQRSQVTVAVGYQAGAPFMVFTGSAR